MSRDDRGLLDDALRRARHAAYPPGEFVGQESFMRAGEIRALAEAAEVGPDSSVLDLCCGVAGPGRLLACEYGCSYLGVDASPSAVELARERAVARRCRFEVARVPPVPWGPFDVVVLLETLLAFPEKRSLLAAVAAALRVGGRFAFSVEAGRPLTAAERAAMPEADTVWPVLLPDLIGQLDRAGLRVGWMAECTRSHLATVEALIAAFDEDRGAITARLGDAGLDRLLAGHRLWRDWLAVGRVRKFLIVTWRTR